MTLFLAGASTRPLDAAGKPRRSVNSTGRTFSSGVPVKPRWAKERPPTTSSPPPRSATNSALMASWSRVKKSASMLARTRASYAYRSSRRLGKPRASGPARSAAAWTKNVSCPSALRPLRTTISASRLGSRAHARCMKLCSNPGAPATTRSRRFLPAGLTSTLRTLFSVTDSAASGAISARYRVGTAGSGETVKTS